LTAVPPERFLIRMKDIIKKWYYKLGFPKKYEEEFLNLLDGAELTDDIKISDIENSTENCPYNLLYSLYFVEDMWRIYKERNIPEKILLDTAYDIVRWTEVWYDINGKLGLDLMGWISDHLNVKLFKLGRLEFDFDEFSKDYIEHGISKGEKRIGVHIPAEGPLTPELCDESFNQAKEFFKKYYPEYEYEYFTCYSWLLDETLDKYTKETSNITKFRRRFTLIDGYVGDGILQFVFRWDARRSNLENFKPSSKFAELIKDAVLAGEQFHSRLGIIKK